MSYKQSADGVFELISFYSYMIDLKDNETCIPENLRWLHRIKIGILVKLTKK